MLSTFKQSNMSNQDWTKDRINQLTVIVIMCMCVICICVCIRKKNQNKTIPALAVVPPVGASPPSSSSASGSPAVCVCGHYVLSGILLHKSESVGTRHQYGRDSISKPYLVMCRYIFFIMLWANFKTVQSHHLVVQFHCLTQVSV